jgi:hypothetical protein
MSNTLFEYLCAKYVKGANQSKRYISRLSTLFLWTNIVCLSARNIVEKRGIGLQKRGIGLQIKVNGRARNPRATRGCSNGQLGAPDCPVCTGQCSMRHLAQRSNGRLYPNWKEIVHRTSYSGCPVAHRTVRCATRQKARIAFLVGLQRLLAALGL